MSEPTAAGNPLDVLIAEYIQAAEAGQVPSRQALLDAHSDYADELRAFFADYDRLDNQADALKLATHRPPAQRPKVRYLGDFELLEEIAEGGMGLVYKARQESLGRIVALKLVRTGRVAKPIDIARFRIEAEAAAGLDHPNIVPLYEVGEHEGQHYLAMKFIDGPPLGKLPRGSIKTEVARLEAIARAVDFAHRQGILHRDIKPSNILTDAAGTPYVTDFGLAKRIDAELSLTESGQMLGTAGYIAPEQALGKKGLTVTADVFSLGAVLFERLTGTPTFPGGTILERLRSLHESITPRPTLLMPSLPRDLETVVLKCLEREPGKRYATAGAMADDLGRWQRGEPIVARRVTQLERFWLWCRRNPAVAGLTGATAAALVVGTGVSSYFAVQAENRAAEALQARKLAEHNYLGSFLRPMGYHADTLDPAEHYAFFELAELPDDQLRIQFLDEALSDGDKALRVARQSERVVQAVIGASERRRQMALALLSARQRDATVDARIRLAACWLAMELASTDLPAAQESIIWAAKRRSSGADDFVPFVAVKRLNDEQVRLLQPFGIEALRASDKPAIVAWSTDLAVRLDRSTAIRVSDELVSMLARTPDPDALQAATQAWFVLAPYLEPAAASRVWNALFALRHGKDGRIMWSVSQGLAAVAPQLDARTAAEIWEDWVSVLTTTKDWQTFANTNEGIGAAAKRLEPSAAIRTSDRLIGILAETVDENVYRTALVGLTMLDQRLDRPAAMRAARAMIDVFPETSDDSSRRVAAEGIANLAAMMDQPAAIEASDNLVHGLDDASDATMKPTIRALAALAPHLDGPAANRASDGLINLFDQAIDENSRAEAIGALAVLAPRLDAAGANRAWDGLFVGLAQSTDEYSRSAAVRAMAALAKRPDIAAAARVLTTFDDASQDPNDGLLPNDALLWQIVGLQVSAVAELFDQPTANRVSDSLVGVLSETKQEKVLSGVSRCLADLARKVDKPTAIRATDGLLGALGTTKSPTIWTEMSLGLSAFGPKLDPPTAIRASDGLVGIVRIGKDDRLVWAASRGLATLAPLLDPQAKMRAFNALDALVETGDDNARSAALAVAATMAPAERHACQARIAQAVVGWLRSRRDDFKLKGSWDRLSFVIDQFDPDILLSVADGRLTLADIGNTSDYATQFDVGGALFTTTTDLATIADCLRHPACVGETRQMVLHRLEELAFPPADVEQQQALAESVVTGLTQPLAGGVLAAGRQAKWERERKFRTIWDAVAWLNKNHPEIDLDKPYRPRK